MIRRVRYAKNHAQRTFWDLARSWFIYVKFRSMMKRLKEKT